MTEPASQPVSLGARIAALTRAGRGREAVALIEAALRRKPGDATLLVALAQVHNRVTRAHHAALAAAKKVIAKAPRNVAARLEAAQAEAGLGRYAAALGHLGSARKAAPKDPDVLYVLAAVQHRMDDFEAEVSTLDNALDLRPDHLPSRLQRATALLSAGRVEDAAEACREIFADAPDSLPLYTIYTKTVRADDADPLIGHFRDSVAAAQTVPEAKATALKLLARIDDDLGRHDDAMRRMAEANAIEGLRHDGRRQAAFVAAQTRISRAAYFGAGGLADDAPVFIVGMPRSGSTLLEQVLTRHPQVAGVGESRALRLLVQAAGVAEGDGAGLQRLTVGLKAARAQEMGAAYLEAVRATAGAAPRIVDKHLHNFELLGLVGRILPKARILHALRDPMDTCVSCYQQRLSGWHSYTRDFGDLGRYYAQYRRLMDHWKAVLPNPMMAVRYEDMVADPEATARSVIGFLGLDWDPACLDHTAAKEVRTLSVAQVRQPIYDTSVARWRRYEAHLGPLKAELAQFYPGGLD